MSGTRARRMARVESAMRAIGITGEIVQLRDNTATAALAAAALGCDIGEIAKSLMFRRLDNHRPVLAVLSGAARVDITKLSRVCGGAVKKADADFVKAATGFEIGGVPPISHADSVLVIMDEGLKDYAKIWAAAGSAHAVFACTPVQLAATATVADIAE